MDLDKLLYALRERCVFSHVRSASRRLGIPTSTGWEGLLAKLAELEDDELENALDGLERVLLDLTLYGDKAVQYFHVTEAVGKEVAAALGDFVDSESRLTKRFPLALTEEELFVRGVTTKIVPVAFAERSAGNSLITCSKIYQTERDKRDVESMSDEAKAEFEGYDQVIAVRRRPRQQFDVVSVLPSHRLIEIRTSLVALSSHKEAEDRLKRLRENFNKWVAEALNIDNVLGRRLNVFRAIEKLYQRKDGKVIDNAVLTSGGLNKHERMPRKNDLRSEQSHAASESVSQAKDRYQIAKNWDSSTVDLKPELSIPGTLTSATAQKPTLYTVYILKCATGLDYASVRKRLLRELPRAKQGTTTSAS